jgi:hypothetical protein
MKTRTFGFILAVGVIIFGCSVPVMKQDVPVSTNPMGAKVYANGQLVGNTPTTVSLERNRDHILTLQKDNYRQQDVVIRKQYQQNKVLMKAIQSGVNSGLFFKDARMGMNSGMSSISTQEESGEAYILVPPVVTVNLVPLYGPPEGGALAPPGRPYNSPGPDVSEQSGAMTDQAPPDEPISTKDVLKAGAVAGAAVALQGKPVEKKWDTSSSSRSYTKPDGTMVRETSGTSVSVGVNPAGLADVIDKLFK